LLKILESFKMNDDSGVIQKPKRRIILPKVQDTNVIPKVENLLSDAMIILSTELSRYKDKVVKRGAMLDLKEARVVANYIESITKLNKEARESARMNDFSKMSDQELRELMDTVLGVKAESRISDKQSDQNIEHNRESEEEPKN